MDTGRYILDKKEDIRFLEIVEREKKLKPSQDFITTIVGPRRAGKTYFIYSLIKTNRLNDSSYLFVDFEDPIDEKDPLKIMAVHSEVYGREPEFLFFDEIHGLENWQKFIRYLHSKKRYKIVVTGSSSKLLSREIATQLRGRSVSVNMFPFSFAEIFGLHEIPKKKIYSTNDENRIKRIVRKFFGTGFFPDVVLERVSPVQFYKEYFELVISRDLIERFRLRNRFIVEYFLKTTVSGMSNKFSIHRFFNDLKSQNIHVSKKTLYNLQKIIEDIQVVFFLRKYERSQKKSEMSRPKVYLVDNGIYRFTRFEEEKGKILENLVFQELLKKGYRPNRDIYYWESVDGKEVDFVIKKGTTIRQLIQVTYTLDYSNKHREIRSLLKASRELGCKNLLVITWDYENEEKTEGRKIKFIPLWKWLIQ